MKPSDILSSSAKVHVMRLKPGDDLKKSIQEYAAHRKWNAGIILTCVGSLVEYHLRFANQREDKSRRGHFEIVSLVGTLSGEAVHLHMSVADSDGVTIGGHLLDGNVVYTTAEIALAELPDLTFHREFDPASGYHELFIAAR